MCSLLPLRPTIDGCWKRILNKNNKSITFCLSIRRSERVKMIFKYLFIFNAGSNMHLFFLLSLFLFYYSSITSIMTLFFYFYISLSRINRSCVSIKQSWNFLHLVFLFFKRSAAQNSHTNDAVSLLSRKRNMKNYPWAPNASNYT